MSSKKKNGEPDEPIYEIIYDSINKLIGQSNGKNVNEIKALKSTIEKLRSKHKLEIAAKENEIEAKELQIQAKEIQIKERENQIQAKGIQIKDFELQNKAEDVQILERENQLQGKDIQIQKLKNEIEILKMKTNDVDVTPLEHWNIKNKWEQKQLQPLKEEYDKMSDDYLFTKGIEQFFFRNNFQTGYSYPEWFDVIRTKLRVYNCSYVFQKFVLVKVKCFKPNNSYYFTSFYEDSFYDQRTKLNIFNRGWRHESATVSILHPNDVNNSLKMKEDGKEYNHHQWKVTNIPKDYIDKDGYFIILCLKK